MSVSSSHASRSDRKAAPSFGELVLQWAKSAHSLSSDDRVAILELELTSAERNRRLGVKSTLSAATERSIEKHRQLLESYSLSEDRCFEAQARQIHAANGVAKSVVLDPEVTLELTVRNRYASIHGSTNVSAELHRQSAELGEPVSNNIWNQGAENIFVCVRKYTLGYDPDTTIVDTITFHTDTFRITHIHRTLLPSHSPDPVHHIQFGSINYLDSE